MSEPTPKRRRVELSLVDKIKLIKDSESLPKPTLKTLSEKFGVGKSTVSDILKRSESYKEDYEKNGDGKKCRVNSNAKYGRLNELVWQWFCQARAKAVPISGPILQEKASQFARELSLSEFKGSNGWLDRWKSHYNVKGFKVSGESAGVDPDVVEDYRSRIPDIVTDYAAKDVFNCDESGLYYRALPDRTLSVRGEASKGCKISKDRVTLMFACSAAGEKLKPLVIGKSKNPRCFKNVRIGNLPVHYMANKKAWMTGQIFCEWISEVNKLMKRQRRHILMFLDNATCHTPDIRLSNVTLKFLPANTTSVLQPLDHGIIRAFKARYRKHMLQSLVSKIDSIDNAQKLCKEISLLDCIHWIAKSWMETQPSTITKCFNATGFPTDNDGDTEDESNDQDEISLLDLAKELNFELDENCDSELPTEDDSSDWEKALVDQFRDSPTEDSQDHVGLIDDYDDDDSMSEIQPGSEMNYEDVLGLLRKLKNFALLKDERFLMHVQELESLTEVSIAKQKCAKRQSTLDSFFKPS